MDNTKATCCNFCWENLPTFPSQYPKYDFATEVFGGRVPITQLTVLSTFFGKSQIQHLLHSIKYNGNTTLAMELGERLGERWKESGASVIVPIPLHLRKEKSRGYNQCEWIAKGMSRSSGIPFDNLLRRINHTPSQTTLDRNHRWENVKDAFEINSEVNTILNKRILLVDDTLTTGATMEACANVLIECGAKEVFATAIAYAS